MPFCSKCYFRQLQFPVTAPAMRLSNWRGILWFIWCSSTSSMVGQCTREELDRVGEEVAICVIRQQDMVMEVEKIFMRGIYIEEALCLMLENIKDKCVQMWSQCYQDRQVGCSSIILARLSPLPRYPSYWPCTWTIFCLYGRNRWVDATHRSVRSVGSDWLQI